MGSFWHRPNLNSLEDGGTPDGPPAPIAPPAESPPVDFPPDVLLAEAGLMVTAGGLPYPLGFPPDVLAAEAGLAVTAGGEPPGGGVVNIPIRSGDGRVIGVIVADCHVRRPFLSSEPAPERLPSDLATRLSSATDEARAAAFFFLFRSLFG